MAEPFISQITGFGLNFPVRSWAYCNGAVISIANNTALFSLIGCTYGGDCRSTMALPDMRGRLSFQHGSGPGLPNYAVGAKGGSYDRVDTVSTMASHNHGNVQIGAATIPGTEAAPTATSVPAISLAGSTVANAFAPDSNQSVQLSGQGSATGDTGGGQSYSIQNPYISISYEIALFGVYPSRS